MRATLEYFRVIAIFIVYGAFGIGLTQNMYAVSEITEKYTWVGAIAIFVLLFVFYRNKMQFTRWYKGEGKKKLPKSVTIALISFSVLLIMAPYIFYSI